MSLQLTGWLLRNDKSIRFLQCNVEQRCLDNSPIATRHQTLCQAYMLGHMFY